MTDVQQILIFTWTGEQSLKLATKVKKVMCMQTINAKFVQKVSWIWTFLIESNRNG